MTGADARVRNFTAHLSQPCHASFMLFWCKYDHALLAAAVFSNEFFIAAVSDVVAGNVFLVLIELQVYPRVVSLLRKSPQKL